MKIAIPNFIEASGPSFSCASNIPLDNLPIYLYQYDLSNPQSVVNWSVVSLKPSSFNNRVIQLQARILMHESLSYYVLTYTFNKYDEVYQVYKDQIVYAATPSGTFSISGDDNVYNASDYWTFTQQNNTIQLLFTPSISMNLSYSYLFYDILL
jgi:hypothetical protein